MKKNAIIFLNGKFLPLAKANVSVMDRGFHYGDGLFETVLAQDRRPVDLILHLQRLRQGAKVLRIPTPYSNPEIRKTILTLLRKNNLDDALIKIMVTRGKAEHIGLSPRHVHGKPTFCMFVWSVDPAYAKKKSFRVIIGSIARNKTPISGLKSLNYLAHVIAKMEADRAGADEAILVDSEGNVLEGTISNIFIVRGRVLITPPLSLGILAGTTRKRIIRLAKKLRIVTREKKFTVRELLRAEESFLTFSSAGIMPIHSVGKKKIGKGVRGPITCALLSGIGQ